MSARRFAEGTEVPAAKSRMEIENTLAKYGATSFSYGSQGRRAMVAFEVNVHGQKGEVGWRRVRFDLVLPALDDPDIRYRPNTRKSSYYPRATDERTEVQKAAALDAEVRRRWRSLALAIKAKMECVATGISSFEDEFLARIVLPDGSAFGEWARPELERVYQQQSMPRGLLSLPPGRSSGDAVDAEFREDR